MASAAGFDGTPLHLPLGKLVMRAQSITGHLTGSPFDTELAMRFAVATGVRPRVQAVPLEEARQALGRDTVCLEARERVGGRALSTPAAGGALDLGATWFWDGEKRIAELPAQSLRLGTPATERAAHAVLSTSPARTVPAQ